MAQEGYHSCSGCGRLFKDDGSEDDMFEEHDCNEEEHDGFDAVESAIGSQLEELPRAAVACGGMRRRGHAILVARGPGSREAAEAIAP